MGRLPKAPFEKILKESSKNIRVSDAAAQALTEFMEELAQEYAKDAADLARHAQRRTILEHDITMAKKRKR
ncbi:MAG: NFYB/HAP3 family transcription factor subunit [Candidatus Marinimicrobia bacterium]|nr:NFYB/HAP3 family transcription factor subunit [Candidatus Neomarinimicrobiota bacterium]